MPDLVRLGMGLAVVNACRRRLAGVVARPVAQLPAVRYHLVQRRDGLAGVAALLRQHPLAHADAWRDGGA